MTTEEFRDALMRLSLSQGGLARLWAELGDTAAPLTIRRRVERWAQGGAPVPGEAAAFLNLLLRFPRVMEALREAPPGRGKSRIASE